MSKQCSSSTGHCENTPCYGVEAEAENDQVMPPLASIDVNRVAQRSGSIARKKLSSRSTSVNATASNTNFHSVTGTGPEATAERKARAWVRSPTTGRLCAPKSPPRPMGTPHWLREALAGLEIEWNGTASHSTPTAESIASTEDELLDAECRLRSYVLGGMTLRARRR